jgi:hypothetical protein
MKMTEYKLSASLEGHEDDVCARFLDSAES